MIQQLNGEFSMLLSSEFDRSEVNLLDIVKLDEKTYGRLDMIATGYYKSVEFLPLLLEWNNITDVAEMRIGDLIEIPDLIDLINKAGESNQTLVNDFEDGQNMDIPGIVENDADMLKSSVITGSKTTANPTLNITQKGTVVDESNGLIIYR